MPVGLGSVVDRYTVLAELGRGASAVVYRVRHAQLGTEHALKVLMTPSPSVRDRLLQEGRIQAALQHPNVVRVTDVVRVHGAPGLVMELVNGPSLEVLLQRHRLTLAQCDALVPGILRGVAAAHARGLVHRDLKPGNILLSVEHGSLVPKVTDFGLAKILHGDDGVTRTRAGVLMGTPAYMAPEQIRDASRVDARADVFALGAILYEMTTGHRAFEGEDVLEVLAKIGAGERVSPRSRVADLPERIEATIHEALTADLETRTQRCDDMLARWDAPPGDGAEFPDVLVTGFQDFRAHPTRMPTPSAAATSSLATGALGPVSPPIVPASWRFASLAFVAVIPLAGALGLWSLRPSTPTAPASSARTASIAPVTTVIPAPVQTPPPVTPAVRVAAPAPKARKPIVKTEPAPPATPLAVQVQSRGVALVDATVDGVSGRKLARALFAFDVAPGRHQVQYRTVDGRSIEREWTVAASGDRYCWDFDRQAECDR